jgi:uncharacterized protein (DUF2062 family)
MPKRLISKYLPEASAVSKHRSVAWLGNILHDSNLWHLNRRSVASAMFAGVFACFMPIPGQMLLAATLAIYFHCNLPLTLALTWISNPLTYAPIYYLCYRLGLLILGQGYDPSGLEWSVDAIGNNLGLIMKPLIAGCLISGVIFGALAYFTVRIIWRLHVQRAWIKRKAVRAKNKIGDKFRQTKQHCMNTASTTELEQEAQQTPKQGPSPPN